MIFLGLALAFGYWHLSGDDAPPEEAPTMAARDEPPAPIALPSSPPPMELPPDQPEMEQTEETIQMLRARTHLNRELGIQALKLTEVDGIIKIPFVFKAEKQWCRGGDLDTVKFLKPEPKALEFLVTIEALTGKQRGDRMRVSADMLFQGLEKTFEVAMRNPTESFGLYICRDLAKTNSCRGKTLETHRDISMKLADNATSAETVKKDFQLYFQNFIVKDGELITYDNTNIGKERTDKLAKHLGESYGLQIPDFKAAWDVTKILRSVPAKIENNKITLTLPYNDPRCRPGAERPTE